MYIEISVYTYISKARENIKISNPSGIIKDPSTNMQTRSNSIFSRISMYIEIYIYMEMYVKSRALFCVCSLSLPCMEAMAFIKNKKQCHLVAPYWQGLIAGVYTGTVIIVFMSV